MSMRLSLFNPKERAGIEELGEKLGYTLDGTPESYGKLHDYTIQNQAEFYSSAIGIAKFAWIKQPEKILEWNKEDPIWKAKWFIGGQANAFNACIEVQIDRGLGGSGALAWMREDGKTETLTFNQVRERVDGIAKALASLGQGKGSRIAVVMPTTPEAYLLFYAIQKIGATFIPIPTDLGSELATERIAMAKPAVVLTVDRLLQNGKEKEMLSKVLAAVDAATRGSSEYGPIVVCHNYVGSNMVQELAKERKNLLDYDTLLNSTSSRGVPDTVPMTMDDTTMILFTSGTTGKPKGTIHTFAALIEDITENALYSNIKKGDRSFWHTSPGWMMFPWLVTGANGLGATTVLYDGSPTRNGGATLLKFAESMAVTHFGTSPAMIRVMLEELEAKRATFPKHTKEFRYTSEPLSGLDADRLRAATGLLPNGACGGTDGCFCYCEGNPNTERKGATMLPGLGMNIHVVIFDAEKKEWRDAKPGEIGEIAIKSPFPSMTNGLVGDDAERTMFRKSYFNYGKEQSRRGGESKFWFHGDSAAFDDEGRLTIHRRADDVLVVHGNKYSPVTFEDEIKKAEPEVREAAAITSGGELYLFVVTNSGLPNTADSGLEQRIRATIKSTISAFAQPKTIMFVKNLPYTITNKRVTYILRKLITKEELGDTSTLRNPECIPEIKAAITAAGL